MLNATFRIPFMKERDEVMAWHFLFHPKTVYRFGQCVEDVVITQCVKHGPSEVV